MTLKELLTRPVTIATSGALGLAHLLGIAWIDPLIQVVIANIATIFTIFSISGFSLAPEVAWLPEETLTKLALVAGGIYVLTLVDRVIDQIQNRMEDDTN
jgi:hypothetical protein